MTGQRDDPRTIAQQVVAALRRDRHRHAVLPARRAERRLLRRPRRRHRHPPDRQPPRAGRGLHGERRLARRGQAGGVLRRARARACSTPARRLTSGYWSNARTLAIVGEIPTFARGRGFGVLHELVDQHAILGQLTKQAELLDDGDSATKQLQSALDALVSGRPRPVEHRSAGQPVAHACSRLARAAGRDQAGDRPARDRPRRRRAAPRRTSVDRRRRWRPGRGRSDRRAGRAAAGAGDHPPHGTRRDPDRASAVRPPRDRARAVEDRRRRDRHRLAPRVAAHALGHRRRR